MEINRQNYESIFLLYLDRELNAGEQGMVEKFLNEHPDLKKEFLLLQQTVFTPEEIVFEHKESLFRKEEPKKIIPLYWVRIAAAVAVLIFGSWLLIGKINSNPKPELADKKPTLNNPASSQDKTTSEAHNSGRKNTPASEEKNLTSTNQNPETENPSPAEEKKRADQNAGNEHALVKEENKKNGKIPGIVDQTNGQTALVNKDPKNTAQSVPKSNTGQNLIAAGKQTEAVLPAAVGSMAVNQKEGVQQNVAQQSGVDPAESISAVKNSPVGLEPVKPENLNTAAAVMATTPLIVDNAYGKPEKNSSASYAVENDNAISVIALNENNKAITGFFKKLTRQKTPANDKERKLRVSVFQISY